MRREMGGVFDWGRVSEPQMRSLADKMFDSAHVPAESRKAYWDWFDRMKTSLEGVG